MAGSSRDAMFDPIRDSAASAESGIMPSPHSETQAPHNKSWAHAEGGAASADIPFVFTSPSWLIDGHGYGYRCHSQEPWSSARAQCPSNDCSGCNVFCFVSCTVRTSRHLKASSSSPVVSDRDRHASLAGTLHLPGSATAVRVVPSLSPSSATPSAPVHARHVRSLLLHLHVSPFSFRGEPAYRQRATPELRFVQHQRVRDD